MDKNFGKDILVKIGDNIYKCIIPANQKIGLLRHKRGELKNKGMLFHFPSKEIELTSIGMSFPIKVIIVDNYQVQEIVDLNPGDILQADGQYAIEFDSSDSLYSNIKLGDQVVIDFNPKKKLRFKVKQDIHSYLLDEDGNIQMKLEGDERIYSRKDTRKILAYIRKKPTLKNKLNLGKLIVDIVQTHNTQKEEYVKK